MSDVSQGPGWWQASDGKWYAPEQASATQTTAMPVGTAPSYAPPAGTPASPAVGPGGQQLAEFGPRAIAFLIDWAISVAVIIVGVIVSIILGFISSILGFLVGLLLYLVAAAVSLWFGYQVGQTGQSPGMRTQGIRCISEETGQPIGGGMGIVRSIAHIVDSLICYVGWLFPLWDPKKQTIADKLIKTVVVTGAPKESFSVDMLKPQA